MFLFLHRHLAGRSEGSDIASMPCNSAPLPFNFTPSAQSLATLGVQAPAPYTSQPQPFLSGYQYLFPPTLTPSSFAPPSHLADPSMSFPHSTLLPSVHSLIPQSHAATAFAPQGSNLIGSKPGFTPGQLSASQRLHDTASMPSMPLYSADAYGVLTGSLPYCPNWPQNLTDTTWGSSLAKPKAAVPLPAGTDLKLDLGKPLRSHSGTDDDLSSVDSDPATLVEDALLGELFFAQPEACQVRALCKHSHVDHDVI